MEHSENEVLIEKLKTATQNLIAYQSENESLKKENQCLRNVVNDRDNAIDRMNATISAYRECMMIVAGKKKR